MEFTADQVQRITRQLSVRLEGWLKESQVEPHYSVATVAELLDVAERTVWSWVDLGQRSNGASGIWPVVKLSHKNVRIPASSVNRMLRAHVVSAPTATPAEVTA